MTGTAGPDRAGCMAAEVPPRIMPLTTQRRATTKATSAGSSAGRQDANAMVMFAVN